MSDVRAKSFMTLALVVAAIVALFARDAADMAAQWWNISTYQHCLYVMPIVAWLLWLRRGELKDVVVAGWAPGALLVLGSGLVWLVGEAGGVSLLRHVGLVLMVQASVITLLGPAFARAILFPLFYLIFLVPFGDEFTGPMQTLTARMAMGLLGLTGVPATIDGVFITTRAGWFEVAEACAGVKFLVAMAAYGALAANVCFRSTLRRVVFMAAAIVVPVLANGVRAWATMFAAEFIGVEHATGFDHIVYGWVFFAVVMIAIMGAAWPFFDRKIGEDWLGGKTFPIWKPVASIAVVAPLAVVAALVPVGWNAAASASGRVTLPHRVDMPQIAGWSRVGDLPGTPWAPRFDGADHKLLARFGDAGGQRVDVGIALYGWQDRGRQISGFGQGAADPQSHWAWAERLPPIAGASTDRIMGPNKAERVAATFRFAGGQRRDSTAAIKFATLRGRLLGSDQSAATLIVSAEGPQARAAVERFVAAMGDPAPVVAKLIAQGQGR